MQLTFFINLRKLTRDTINILYKFEHCLKLIENEDKESIIWY